MVESSKAPALILPDSNGVCSNPTEDIEVSPKLNSCQLITMDITTFCIMFGSIFSEYGVFESYK